MHPALAACASAQHGVFTHRQARAAGYLPAEIRHRVASGRWTVLRRGVLAEASTVRSAASDARARHLLAADAALVASDRPGVLSHRTAVALWGLPQLGALPTQVALTVEHQHRRRSPGLELHTAVTPTGHRAVVDGRPVTSVARTLSDLARSAPLKQAVVAADAALERGLCTREDLVNVVADCWVWPGIARTKRLIEVVDGRAESPGESLSRLAFVAADLPAPELQVELVAGGQHVRVDFLWVAHRLVGEFDGRLKYATPEDLWREKLREDRIRAQGYRVVRWTWSDVHPDPSGLVARLRSALA